MESQSELLVEELGWFDVSAVDVNIVEYITVGQKLVENMIGFLLLLLILLGNILGDNSF